MYFQDVNIAEQLVAHGHAVWHTEEESLPAESAQVPSPQVKYNNSYHASKTTVVMVTIICMYTVCSWL